MIPILITVRLKSQRLPLKALRSVGGRPLLVHLIERLRQSRLAGPVVLCTSSLPTDDPLAWIAESKNVPCFRGHPNDVILRLTETAEKLGAETIISCTGDNPFVDGPEIDRLLEHHRAQRLDFTRVEGLPFGTFAYAAQTAAMREVCNYKTEEDTEGWGKYLMDSRYRWGTRKVSDPQLNWPQLRLTVDTLEDLTLARAIAEQLPSTECPLADIVDLCRRQPSLARLNAHVVQRPL